MIYLFDLKKTCIKKYKIFCIYIKTERNLFSFDIKFLYYLIIIKKILYNICLFLIFNKSKLLFLKKYLLIIIYILAIKYISYKIS